MGARGPIPNRDSDLARPRHRKGEAGAEPAARGTMRPVTIPEPDQRWSAVTRMAYDALLTSGMADFYQDSDWAMAWIALTELDAYQTPAPVMEKGPDGKWQQVVDHETGELQFYRHHKVNGQAFSAILTALQPLGMTEGDRRRMRIELDAPKEPQRSAQLIAIDGYRDLLEEDDTAN